ncbi:MAG: hypothetical protein WDN69_25020 [Aliidongia sp.]
MTNSEIALTSALSADLLHGAEAIALFMFGSEKERRKVYHMADKHGLPVFRMGSTICGRKSTLLRWIEEQEKGRGSQSDAA